MKAASLASHRLSMNLNEGDRWHLKSITQRKRISVTEAVRRALSLYDYVCGEADGSKLVLVSPEGKAKELVLL